MFRELVTEALDKNNTIARSIVNKMDHANWKNISEMDEANYNFIKNICSGISQRFDEADDEDKQAIMDKVYSYIHTAKEEPELEENSPMSQSEIKQKILDYVKEHGAILYPLEKAAEDLAKTLSNEESKEEKDNVEESKKDKSFVNTLKNDIIKSLGSVGTLLGGPLLGSAGKATEHFLKDADEDENSNILSEATMSDIPHEIDDQIHTLKDMRFDIEETEKNWDLAGMDTKPMDNIKNSINDLIEIMYQNGAELADQEIAKTISKSEEDKEEVDQ